MTAPLLFKKTTPLMYAAYFGNPIIVQLLLDAGAEQISANEHNLALNLAMELNHQEVIDVLVTALEIDAPQVQLWKMINEALDKNLLDFADRLHKINQLNIVENWYASLVRATNDNRLDRVRWLLKRKPESNSQNAGYNHILHAARHGNLDMVKELLEANLGSDINIIDSDGNTPLHYAVHHRNAAFVELLLHHKANLNLKNRFENTPLRFAAGQGDVKSVSLLLEAGANLSIEVRYSDYTTTLHLAVANKHFEVIRLLLEYGAEVDSDYVDTAKKALEDDGSELSKNILNILVEYWLFQEKKREVEYEGKVAFKIDTNMLYRVNFSENQIAKINPKVIQQASEKFEDWCKEALPPELFVTTVLYCEGIYQIRSPDKLKEDPTARFFRMMARLPMELQMAISHRVFGSEKDWVLSREFEPHYQKFVENDVPADDLQDESNAENGWYAYTTKMFSGWLGQGNHPAASEPNEPESKEDLLRKEVKAKMRWSRPECVFM